MIQLRALGQVDLLRPDGRRVSSLLHQPKRVGMLLYVACARPPGPTPRAALLGMFWPDRDEDRARHALSQSLYFIRRSLGDPVLESLGDAVALVPDGFSCDAAECAAALERGDRARAVSLYAGELAEGLTVDDAPEFERWLERERGRLRRQVAEAALDLAEVAGAEGRVEDARRFACRALEVRPWDEGAAARLVRILLAAGEVGRARIALHDFSRRLRDELELEPGPELRALAERVAEAGGVRSRPDPGAPPVAPPVAAGFRVLADPSAAAAGPSPPADPPGRAGAAETEGPAKAGRGEGARARPAATSPSRALPRSAAVVAAALFALITVVSRGGEGRPVTPLDRLTVYPFLYTGDERYAHLPDAARELLVQRLAAFDLGERPVSASVATRGGRRVEPPETVSVEIIEVGGRFQVSATVAGGAVAAPTSFVRRLDDEGEIFRVVDELAREVLTRRHGSDPTHLPTAAAGSAPSLEALREYLRGERELRAGRYLEALEAFERAVEEDSTFALAWYRLGSAAGWVGGAARERQLPASEAAVRYGGELARSERALLEAHDAFVAGRFQTAEDQLRRLLRERPESPEARFLLGEVVYHYRPLAGGSVAEAEASFRSVAERDPADAEARKHLAGILALTGRRSAAAALIDTLVAAWGDGSLLEYQALRAELRNDPVLRAEVRERIAAAGSDEARKAVSLLSRTLLEPRRVEPWARGWLATASTAPARAEAHVVLAQVLAAQGRLSAARAELRDAMEFDATLARLHQLRLAVAPFLPPGVRRTASASVRYGFTAPSEAARAADASLSALEEVYLAGLLAAPGAPEQARTLASRLAGEGESGPGRLGSALARALRAEVERLEGRPDSALQELLAVGNEVAEMSVHRVRESALLSFARERFVRAELLRGVGRHREARAWYEGIGQQSVFDLPYLAPSRLARAVMADEAGDLDSAVRSYRAFLDQWGHADPELQAVVASARRRLGELERAAIPASSPRSLQD